MVLGVERGREARKGVIRVRTTKRYALVNRMMVQRASISALPQQTCVDPSDPQVIGVPESSSGVNDAATDDHTTAKTYRTMYSATHGSLQSRCSILAIISRSRRSVAAGSRGFEKRQYA